MNMSIRKRRYGVWSGNPKGYRYKATQCAQSVDDGSMWACTNAHQCSRKPGHGPDGLYCKQHAKGVLNMEQPKVTVSAEVADAFGMHTIPGVSVSMTQKEHEAKKGTRDAAVTYAKAITAALSQNACHKGDIGCATMWLRQLADCLEVLENSPNNPVVHSDAEARRLGLA